MKRIAATLLLVLAACARPEAGPPPARGVILISFDALRADRLGPYGYDKPTSPFLDELSARGVVFEQARVHYPATLVSNLSLFTGLYPEEHGVYPPSGVLSPQIETLPEVFRRTGFRTAGHTEGGFMAGGYGFSRGFEVFTDTPYSAESDVERTFGRGLDFLRGLADGERYFLFLHTFVTHDPYDPPAQAAEELGVGPLPEDAPPPTGPTLRAFNAGELDLSSETIAAYSDRYDASIRYADQALRAFWGEVEAMGLAAETMLVVTSDHGEEFAEHGAMGHTQVYPETLHVPLVVIPPESGDDRWVRNARVEDMVENVRFAPTLLAAAGVEPPPQMSRPTLLPALQPALAAKVTIYQGEDWMPAAYAEVIGERTVRTLTVDTSEGRFQILTSRPPSDPEGAWISRSVEFDVLGERLDLALQSFHKPRTIRLEASGETVAEWEVGAAWTRLAVDLPGGAGLHRVRLSTEGCDSPASLGLSADGRCLSFQVRDQPLHEIGLYDLDADPGAHRDIAAERPELAGRLLRRLATYRFQPLAPPGAQEVPSEVLETLKALGYVD